MRTIIVEAYDPKWADEFIKTKSLYEQVLDTLPHEIVHVGSTSVKGLWAKPILDIDIIVDRPEDVSIGIKLLESLGYKHVGNLGIEGREAFNYDADNPKLNFMDHHLYLCLRGSENLTNHLLLKSYLENHPEAVVAYSQLKQDLAKAFPHDIDSYVEGKTALITGYLKEAGMDGSSLERITDINKKE